MNNGQSIVRPKGTLSDDIWFLILKDVPKHLWPELEFMSRQMERVLRLLWNGVKVLELVEVFNEETLRRIRESNKLDPAYSVISFVLKRCRNLKSLNFCESPLFLCWYDLEFIFHNARQLQKLNLAKGFRGPVIFVDTLAGISQPNFQLEELCLDYAAGPYATKDFSDSLAEALFYLRGLKYLTLNHCGGLTGYRWLNMLAFGIRKLSIVACPNLTSENIVHLLERHRGTLEHFVCGSRHGSGISASVFSSLSHIPKLAVLEMESVNASEIDVNELSFTDLAKGFKRLHTLGLATSNLPGNLLCAILEGAGASLKKLNMDQFSRDFNASNMLGPYLKMCTSLTFLSLRSIRPVNDELMGVINLAHMKLLNISNTLVSLNTVDRIAQRASALKELYINGCRGISLSSLQHVLDSCTMLKVLEACGTGIKVNKLKFDAKSIYVESN